MIMIACDVVLLPSEEVTLRAIEMNRRLNASGNKDIILDREKCLPHITLAMGCVKEKDIDKVETIVKDIASSFAPVKLNVLPSASGLASMHIEKTRDIELLHEIVMIRLAPLFSYKVAPDMIYSEGREDINDLTFDYISKFAKRSSFENYSPHITLGTGNLEEDIPGMEFVSGELALCHLGDFCTCRKKLSTHTLSRQISIIQSHKML